MARRKAFSWAPACLLLLLLLDSPALGVWAAPPAGRWSAPALISERGASIAPELVPGSKLVFQSYRDNNWEIYSANDDGSGQTCLTTHVAPDEYPRLNRGGSRIVFSSTRGGENYNIFAMNADGSGLVQLVFNTADDFSPAWSPDSSRITFVSKRDANFEIYAMNADGSDPVKLTTTTWEDLDPTYSPDGAWIAFASRRTGDFRIWVMDANGGGQTQLSDQPQSRNPAWSPDGSQIAFDADADGDGRKELWLMDADGSNEQLLYDPASTDEDIWARSWSPDGRYIAFTHVWGYQDPRTWTTGILQAWDTQNPGSIVTLIGDGRDWYPDWQTLDVWAPTSNVLPLPGQSAGPFTVSWQGYDNGPAGLRNYDVQVKDGAGAWTDWLVGTTATSASYDGTGGHTYSFRCRAHDNAYNVEPYPDQADSVTTVENKPPQTSVDSLPDHYRGTQTVVSWGGADPGGSGIANYDVQVKDGAGAWTDWQMDTAATSANFSGTAGHTYYFRSRGTDNAYNVEAWPGGDGDTHTTMYTWALHGTVEDNCGTPVIGAVAAITPDAFETIPSDANGAYGAYVDDVAGTYTASWGKSGYGSLPSTPFNAAQDGDFDAVLPPADNAVVNWGFETGQLAPEWLASGSPTPGVTETLHHSGEHAALLGCQQAAWTTPWNIPNSPYPSSYPNLVVDNSGAVHVVWAESRAGLELYYSRRASSGVWSDPEPLWSTPLLSAPPQMAVDASGVVHVVWADNSAGNMEVFYARRETSGSWSSPFNLSATPDTSELPQMALGGGGTVHVVWHGHSGSDWNIYYRQRTGSIWSDPEQVPDSSTDTGAPQMAVEAGGVVHVVWVDTVSGTSDILYARRGTDGTWSGPQNVSQNPGASAAPQVAADGSGAAHVVWAETGTNSDIYYARRSSSGTWSSPTNVSNNGSASTAPQLVVESSGVVHLVWNDTRPTGKGDLYYGRRATDGTWSVAQNISNTSGESSLQRVVYGGGAVHAIWLDDTTGNNDIYYARRESDGVWSLVQNASHNSGLSQSPQLAAEGYKTAHLVWADSTPAVRVIYYSQVLSSAETGNSTITQSVTVAITMAAPTLSFLYLLDGASPTSGSWLSAQVTSGLNTTTLFSTTSGVASWTHRWFDLTPWAGQSVDVVFTVHQTAGHICTWGYIEEVTLGSAYADVWVSKSGAVNSLLGSEAVYTLTYGNRGGTAADGVQLSDSLPGELAFVAASRPPDAITPALRWDLGQMPAESGPFAIVVTATVAPTATLFSQFTNTTSISTTSTELETANNLAQAATFVGQQIYLPLVLSSYMGHD